VAQDDGSFLSELSRRNVWRIGIAYIIAAWLILQVLETIASVAGAPDWVGKFVLGVIVVGLPIALILAWVYELTPEGIRREKEVARTASITHETGARLNKITIGVFLVAVVWVASDRLLLSRDAPPAVVAPVNEEVVATEITDKSIAVLPFMNMSEDASAGHFSDGLADTVLHKLAQIQSLRVVARNSSFQYRGQNVDVRQVGEKLNVATVLEGSVQAAGNKIRVTAQLIDVANGYHLWSGNFDRELTDVFGIQDEIAEKVVDALQVSLGDEDSARLARRDTDNVDAFREYSLALREIDDYSFDSLDRALAHLDKATEIDPGYALAWAMKGLTWRHMNVIGSRTNEEYRAGARVPVERALELDPELPLAMALIAELDYDNSKVDTALPMIERAVALAPNDPTVLGVYSSVLNDELRPFDAADVRLQALELDPLSIPAHQSAAELLDRLGRDDEALAIIERMRVINPDAPVAYWG
jgi:TolB-like protein